MLNTVGFRVTAFLLCLAAGVGQSGGIAESGSSRFCVGDLGGFGCA
jgi:hypothetical protein